MKARDARLPAVGTTLTRSYKGADVVIRFCEDGVEWLGVGDPIKFTSLSALARAATGAASINGFLWAGLSAPTPTAAAAAEAPKAADATVEKKSVPATEKIGGESNAIGEAAGQREALRAAGIVR